MVILIIITSFYSIANADEVSHREAVEELLRLTNVNKISEQIFKQMNSIMEQQFNVMGLPDEQSPILKKYTGKLTAILEKELNWDKMKDQYITIYTNTFTENLKLPFYISVDYL